MLREKLSDCEEQVLLTVYGVQETSSTRELCDMVNEKFHHEWTQQTVSTFIARLIKKGYLTRDKKGRYCIYKAAVPLEEYRRMKLLELVERIFDGSGETLREYVCHMGNEQS